MPFDSLEFTDIIFISHLRLAVTWLCVQHYFCPTPTEREVIIV
ncbi:hypothetical protein B6N60_02226 [Richelia sinica FACHB-800]|uniref:Uncharacterized protein n=1 Tax=Richelia sinica FACHB-800 TaxID=1357546 RepID=A0A975Y4U2_9NOST|nr:hypothetical protein B6N60_02226 [Richelia sinica FACHB-800]